MDFTLIRQKSFKFFFDFLSFLIIFLKRKQLTIGSSTLKGGKDEKIFT